jgi:putative aldouronate transport system substrate-binding protein
MTADESDEFSTLYAEIKKVRDTMTTSFITGVVSIEKYDEFIQKLHQLKVDRVIELQQAAVDRYDSRK